MYIKGEGEKQISKCLCQNYHSHCFLFRDFYFGIISFNEDCSPLSPTCICCAVQSWAPEELSWNGLSVQEYHLSGTISYFVSLWNIRRYFTIRCLLEQRRFYCPAQTHIMIIQSSLACLSGLPILYLHVRRQHQVKSFL